MNFRDYSGPPAFEIVTKPFGPICNLNCEYCFYLEKENLFEGETSWAMAPDVLESYIRQTIESHQTQKVRFVWQGGEPTLLGLEYFHRIADLQDRYANGKHIENALQTNGVLLNDEWCEFFQSNRFLIGLSVDGPRELHDAYRVFKGGQPSFDRVMHGMKLLQKHQVEFNTLTCVHRANQDHPIEVYRFLKDAGSRFLQFIPIVEPLNPPPYAHITDSVPVSGRSVDPRKFGLFLTRIFDEWIQHDVGRVFVQTFEVALESWLGRPQSLCVFAESCGNALAIEHNGDLYSCDHFVYDGFRLGNIQTTSLRSMVNSMEQRQFGYDKQDRLPRYCRECDVRFACNGECPKNRIILTPDGEPGLNYLCEGYKIFFHHIAEPMDTLARDFNRQGNGRTGTGTQGKEPT